MLEIAGDDIIISLINDGFLGYPNLEISMIFEPNPTRQGVELKARLFRGLADASRFSILEALRGGPLAVSEIVAATGLSQPNVSNHLGCLRDCGLVRGEVRGRSTIYQLSDPRVDQLLRLAEELLADVAHGVYACTRLGPPIQGLTD
jgi:DNA-binding transcriptional ArsR family regulator